MSNSKYEPTMQFNRSAGAFLGAFHKPINEELGAFFEKNEANEGADGMFAQLAAGVYPEEASFADLQQRAPYGNPIQLKTVYKEAVERGWIRQRRLASDRWLALARSLSGGTSESP